MRLAPKATPTSGDWIAVDPQILVATPVVKGTRISVEPVLGHRAEHPEVQDLFAAYPPLTIEDLNACLAYASALGGGEGVHRAPGSECLGQAALAR
jgi:uncharacterized protein (DUF433 family)